MICNFLSLLFNILALNITLGDERLEAYLPYLEGKKVAIFTNHTGIVGDRAEGLLVPAGSIPTEQNCTIPFGTSKPGEKVVYGQHIVDLLLENNINLKFIFSPEHGFRGQADAGEKVSNGIDEFTGLPIYSLYGKRDWVLSEKIRQIDAVVVDIQDVGLRYYTYYITMLELMNECALQDKHFVILDRPNPNGFYVDGTVLELAYKSGVGGLPIATVHGMTLGEIAYMANEEGWLESRQKCKLRVVKCLDYSHDMLYTLLKCPSPNLKDMKAVFLYASMCYFEGTNISVGRGTDYPFEVYGAPTLRGPYSFMPISMPGAKNPLHQGQICHGVSLRDKPLHEILTEGVNLDYLLDAYNVYPNKSEFFRSGGRFFNLLMGGNYVLNLIKAGASSKEIKNNTRWTSELKAYTDLRNKYLLYD